MTDRPRATRFACTADRIFDGKDVLTGHAVLVEGETIRDVAPVSRVPEGWPMLSGGGATLMPGLIDAHVHFMRWQGPLYLAAGVTTVRDTGNKLDWILARRAEWKRHPWPRLFCLGPLVDGPKPYWGVSVACDSADAAGRTVADLAAARVDGIKLYAGLPAEWVPAAAKAAAAARLLVSMHCQSAGVLTAGEAGIDEFFHLDGLMGDLWPGHPPGWLEVWGHPDFAGTQDQQKKVADRIAELGLIATPTLAYWDSRARSVSPGWPPDDELETVPARARDWLRATCTREPDQKATETWQRARDAAEKLASLLLARGVPMLAGTDVPCEQILPGRSLWRELSLLTECGMTAQQALRAATSDAARRLGMPAIGRLARGYAADMVLVSGNPAERIPDKPQVKSVMRAGRFYLPDELISAGKTEDADPALDPWGIEFLRMAGKG